MSGAVEVKYSSRIIQRFPKFVGIQLGNLLAFKRSVHHPTGTSMLKIHGLWDVLPWSQ
jgi:hypothetical protein